MDASQLLPGRPRRWLVTGAAGFIGSHLAESLALAGEAVIAVDDLSLGRQANLDAISASVAAAGRGSLDIRIGDIGDRDFIRQACEGIDCVLHQAAIGSVPRSIREPLVSWRTNANGFIEILDAARLAGVKAFVYASSSSVYGDSPKLPKTEDETGNPLSPYAVTKAVDEMVASVYARSYGMRLAGLRYFNVFGPRQDPEGAYAAVIPKWIAALLRGEPVRINGDGATSRDFCFVDNAVQANLRAAITLLDQPAGHCGAYNVAVGQQTTLLQLFEMLRAMLAETRPDVASAQPVFQDFRAGDIRHSLADVSRAAKTFGYRPTHDVVQGLRVALPWYLANVS